MERNEYLANLALATQRPKWQEPSRSNRRILIESGERADRWIMIGFLAFCASLGLMWL